MAFLAPLKDNGMRAGKDLITRRVYSSGWQVNLHIDGTCAINSHLLRKLAAYAGELGDLSFKLARPGARSDSTTPNMGCLVGGRRLRYQRHCLKTSSRVRQHVLTQVSKLLKRPANGLELLFDEFNHIDELRVIEVDHPSCQLNAVAVKGAIGPWQTQS